jgi:hypothetical protein
VFLECDRRNFRGASSLVRALQQNGGGPIPRTLVQRLQGLNTLESICNDRGRYAHTGRDKVQSNAGIKSEVQISALTARKICSPAQESEVAIGVKSAIR